MDAKIISYINLHQYVASGPTGKLTEYFLKFFGLKTLITHLVKLLRKSSEIKADKNF